MIDLNDSAHSRDRLEIVHQDANAFVKKIFATDVVRASRNILKQRNFPPLFTGAIRVSAAPVISFEIEDDQGVLLMPYVEGLSGEMFSVQSGRSVAHNLSAALSTLLYFELSQSEQKPIRTKLLLEKVDQVADSTAIAGLRQLIGALRRKLEALPAEVQFPVGLCHGDLTLSNVILNATDGIVLIDFLETFLESPLQDVAKLKQDFIYGWSFRKCPPPLRLKADIFCRTAYPQAISQIAGLYEQQISVLTLLALARIAPYVQDETTERWLSMNLRQAVENEKL